MVFTPLDNDIRHYSGQNVVNPGDAAEWFYNKLQKIYNVHLRNEPGVWYGVIPLVGIQPDHKKALLLHSIAAPIQS